MLLLLGAAALGSLLLALLGGLALRAALLGGLLLGAALRAAALWGLLGSTTTSLGCHGKLLHKRRERRTQNQQQHATKIPRANFSSILGQPNPRPNIVTIVMHCQIFLKNPSESMLQIMWIKDKTIPKTLKKTHTLLGRALRRNT